VRLHSKRGCKQQCRHTFTSWTWCRPTSIHKRRLCSDCIGKPLMTMCYEQWFHACHYAQSCSRMRYRLSLHETSELWSITNSLLWLIIDKFTHTAKLKLTASLLPRLRLCNMAVAVLRLYAYCITSDGSMLINCRPGQSRIKTNLGPMLLSRKGPVLFLAFKSDQEVQYP